MVIILFYREKNIEKTILYLNKFLITNALYKTNVIPKFYCSEQKNISINTVIDFLFSFFLLETRLALRCGSIFLRKKYKKKLGSKSVRSFCKAIPKSIEFVCYA